MDDHSQQKCLNDKVLRMRINKMLERSLGTSEQFIPVNVTAELRRWFFSLKMTEPEIKIAAHMTKEILAEYSRRLRWVEQQLEQDVFKRFGG